MSEARRYGLCLLSCVRHQGNYAPLYAAHPAIDILCVADEPDVPDWVRTVNQEFAQRYGVPYLPLADALARPDVDFVSICSEPTRHARLAVAAAQAGVHVLVDKPMATTREDAHRVAAAVRAAGVQATYIHHLFNPAVTQAQALLATDRTDAPWSFHVDLITGGGLGSGFVEDFAMVVNPALSGGGEIMNFLNYAVGYLRYLSGREIESVYSVAGTYFFAPHREYGVEDLGLVALNLAGGVTATVTVGRVPVVMGPAPGHFSVRAQGPTGVVQLDQFQPRVTIDRAAGQAQQSVMPMWAGATGVAGLVDDFLACLESGSRPRCTVDDGVAVAAVVDAVYASLRSGDVVVVSTQLPTT